MKDNGRLGYGACFFFNSEKYSRWFVVYLHWMPERQRQIYSLFKESLHFFYHLSSKGIVLIREGGAISHPRVEPEHHRFARIRSNSYQRSPCVLFEEEPYEVFFMCQIVLGAFETPKKLSVGYSARVHPFSKRVLPKPPRAKTDNKTATMRTNRKNFGKKNIKRLQLQKQEEPPWRHETTFKNAPPVRVFFLSRSPVPALPPRGLLKT